MSTKKTYVGYDLGDGETITEIATLEDDQINQSLQTLFKNMTMPDKKNPGQAIPSVFGYNSEGKVVFASSISNDPEDVSDIHCNFKRRPGDLIKKIDDKRKREIKSLFNSGWPSQQACPEVYTPEMESFKSSVISFTDAIFTNEKFQKIIRDEAVDSSEIKFCVGHPTGWDELDKAIYRAILSCSVLGKGAYAGKPSSLLIAAESRAAFLYVKDKAETRFLPKGTCALLIDVGSSTIDITATTADSRNHQYNSGSNYLGARSIDYIIRERYLTKLRRSDEDWNVYQSLSDKNPTIDQAVTLQCRLAKEEVYSVDAQKSRIIFSDFPPMRITREDIDNDIETVPIADVLKKYINISDSLASSLGKASWKMLFRQFLLDKRAEMDAQKIKIGRIILTGSASKMPVVMEVIKDVFKELPEGSVLSDVDPSRTISQGLALVGPSDDKSKGFQTEVEKLISEEVPKIVDSDIPKLADSISGIIDEIVTDMVRKRINEWKNMRINTLDDMTDLIRKDCSEENLNRLLSNNTAYNSAIEKWTVDVVGRDIALKLKGICDRYGISNFTLDNLNVMKASSVDVSGIEFDPTADIINAIQVIISVIAGIITAIILPFVLGIVIGIISWVSVGLATSILSILLAIPGVGWAILLGIAGIAVIKAASSGLEGPKRELTNKIQKMNLPQWVRNRMSDEKINSKLREANIKEQIRNSILKEESRKEIAKSVTESLSCQIEKRVEDLKYVIESK